MSSQKWPPLDPGTRVNTTKPNTEMRQEWTDEGWASKKSNTPGTILRHHDSHGLSYEVKHPDGSIGHYDPTEIEVV